MRSARHQFPAMKAATRLSEMSSTQAKVPISWPLFFVFVSGAFYGIASTLSLAMLYVPPTILIGMAGLELIRGGGVLKRQRQTVMCLSIGLLMAVSSSIGALISSDAASASYTGTFVLTWVSICVIGSSISVESALKTFSWAGVFVILLFTALTWNELLTRVQTAALSFTSEDRYGGPFLAHPNLIGHLIGCFLVAIFWQFTRSNWKGKAIYALSAACGAAMLLASSSRGGTFAAAGAILSVVAFTSTRTVRGSFKFLFAATVGLGALLLCFPSLPVLISSILELDSTWRGLGSGLSGRTEIWPVVLNQIGTLNIPLIWGGGFRNKWLSDLSESVDNGYLVVLAEIGVVMLALWVGRITYLLVGALRITYRRPGSYDQAVASLILFSLAEAVVSRYFLALGNSGSLLLMMLFIMYTPMSRPQSINYGRPTTLPSQRHG